MKVQKIDNSYISFQNTKAEKSPHDKPDNKGKKSITAIAAIGLAAASTIYMLIRTDKTRIQKILADIQLLH